MFKKNTAVVGFGIGNFINASTGATVTTGTPTETRMLDGVGAALTNAATYNTNAAQWEIDLEAADMNGDVVGLSFALTDCLPISYTINTVLGVPQATIAATNDEMDLVNAPNATAITAIQNGLATPTNITAGTITTCTTNTDLVSAADVVDEFETQSQADPTGFHVNVLEIGGTAQTANDNGADINAVLVDTTELQEDWTNGGRLDLIQDIIAADTTTDIPALIAALNNISEANVNAQVVDVIRTDTIPDSYAADGAQPTIAQALLAIQQMMQEKSITDTTMTVKKPDGSTTAMTLTLDSATAPTSITRAT